MVGGSLRTAGLILVFVFIVMLVAQIAVTSAQAAYPASVVYHGPSSRKWVALTFDDNTVTERSLATLRALQRYEAPATLFLVGYVVDGHPDINEEIVKGMEAGLFEVGDHTATHADLTTLSAAQMAVEIGGGTDAFTRATGIRTSPLCRPPYGRTNQRVAEVAGQEGFLYLVLWDVGTEDWTGLSAQKIQNTVVARAHSGAIILLHMAALHTPEALPGIITRLRAAGYELVKVSTMLKGSRLFVDVPESTEVSGAVARMVQAGHMSGYNENYFGPDDAFVRAQAAKVAVAVGGIHTPDEIENAETPTFADVLPTRDDEGAPIPYPFDFVEEAAAAELIQGVVDDAGRLVFRPYQSVTRVQLAQILARTARSLKGYPQTLPGEPAGFSDVPEYAARDVDLVARLGLVKGYGEGRFGSYEPAKRGHVALVMTRYLDMPAH